MAEAVLEPTYPEITPQGQKKCPKCGENKPTGEYTKRIFWCKSCWKKYNLIPMDKKNRQKRKYGLIMEDIDNMLKEQKNKCASCDKKFTDRKSINIDHKHRFDENGKELPCRRQDIRGLLCRRCNFVLGLNNENKNTFQKQINYLKEWEKINV